MVAAMAAFFGGAGQAYAEPETTTPSSPTPSSPTPSTPDSPGASTLPELPEVTDLPALNEILDRLADGSGSLGDALPGDSDGPTDQQIVVTSPEASSPTGTLTAFERDEDGNWKPVIGATAADFGELGIGEPQDNVYRTPAGTFPLDQAFGREDNPGTKMPYMKVDRQDWWDSDMSSATYNTHVRQPESPGPGSENLYDMGPVYDYAVNVAHNPQRIPGRASAIFLHVANGAPTMGCIAIPRAQMIEVLRWLDPAKNPKITIGVNAQAPAAGDTPSTTNPSAPEATTPESTTPDADELPDAAEQPDQNSELARLLGSLVAVMPDLISNGS